MQLSHNDNRFTNKKHPIIIVCDNINNAPNLGSILRLADAFNVQEVMFCGQNIPLKEDAKNIQSYRKTCDI